MSGVGQRVDEDGHLDLSGYHVAGEIPGDIMI